ncbi:S41 family peptidase [Peristeroidobacter soli]|uniref:S41 family peptidase n=1 Tax=Peristeroidobacter soli TaxID=2497877 RepID=UPI001300B501|nr:S41 family peptidase [Peristeroidobacter soli]
MQRLVELCQLWGTVKWVHPQLASAQIDWDDALARTIAKVDVATSDTQYRAAVDELLAVLNDPATRTVDSRAALSARSVDPIPASIRWTGDRIALLTVPDPNYFIAVTGRIELLARMFDEARRARAAILDLRGNPRVDPVTDRVLNQAFAGLLRESLAGLVGAKFTESSIRYRVHSGFAPGGDASSGGYFSAFVSREGTSAGGGDSARPGPPVFILTDANVSHLLPLLDGLQTAGLASVIHSGEPTFDGGPMLPLSFPEFTALVRVGELIHADGSLGFHPDLVQPALGRVDGAMEAVLTAARSGRLLARPPRPTASSTSPPALPRRQDAYATREYRLVALFEFWNTIHWFFPYQQLMDRSWNDLLAEYIPRIEAARDALEYHLTIAELATHLQDSHVVVSSPVLDDYVGRHVAPLRVKLVENATVIVGMWGAAARQKRTLQIGDAIVSIDGEPVEVRRSRLARYLPASTPQALHRKVDRALLLGPPGSVAVLGVERRDGTKFVARVPRGEVGEPARQTPSYAVLEQGYGYFDLTRLGPQELDRAFAAVRDTPALILDMRGYPRGIFFELAARLATKPAVAARFERPELHAIEFQTPIARKFTQSIVPDARGAYRGKVVMLINEDAISQSEHTALFVEAATDVTFIGSPTNGANGDVTSVALPGGIDVRFSGHDVRHGDGRQLQRMGIQPHIVATPTLAGIRSGRDEVLDRAIEFLKASLP